MSDHVTLKIDGVTVTVPAKTLVVDAAKRADIDIPVFCYHPKMKPVGMCRMCLVEVGMPVRDRETGEFVVDEDGNPKVIFRGLQTGCTVEVADGMVVRTTTEVVTQARDDIIEFLLTSHPLDCPICDKGGECPLQELTMRHGPGTSLFDYSDKMHLAKHVPLGELIYLDRERCIQCARCTRFQSEIVDDPVIAFHNRGRKLEIVTMSEPGFDSYWSGNTTDICPVGALTTADFRFGARPWEMTTVASICPHCPVGCNTVLSTRQEAKSGGREVIKRIMPRQNEYVNEIWICDKGRFVHHFADHGERLTKPLVRENGKLVETSWEKALDLVAGKLQVHGRKAAGLTSGRLSNEDLFMFQKLFRKGIGSSNIDLADRRLAGGDVIAQVGLSSGSNLLQLGHGDAILVVATDLHEEAPVWWLQLKQASERGTSIVVVNLRPTRLDKYAAHVIRSKPGEMLSTVHQLLNAAKVDTKSPNDPLQTAANTLMAARNLVVFYGYEGLNVQETDALARLLGNLLLVREPNGKDGECHAGKRNSGLIAVWPQANTQGAWDMGIHPRYAAGHVPLEEPGMEAPDIYLGAANGELSALYLAGADPIGDGKMKGRGQLAFMVVQDLFLTETARKADVVLPAQSWAEREGTYTSGTRRVQRFYQAIQAVGDSLPDWLILARVGEKMGLGKPPFAASLMFREIAQNVPQYQNFDYRKLAWTEEQWPNVGGDDFYYGGTSYRNQSGLGIQWAARAESGNLELYSLPDIGEHHREGLVNVSAASLYAPGTLINHSTILAERIMSPTLFLHPQDAIAIEGNKGQDLTFEINGTDVVAAVEIDADLEPGVSVLKGAGHRPGISVINIRRELKQEVVAG